MGRALGRVPGEGRSHCSWTPIPAPGESGEGTDVSLGESQLQVWACGSPASASGVGESAILADLLLESDHPEGSVPCPLRALGPVFAQCPAVLTAVSVEGGVDKRTHLSVTRREEFSRDGGYEEAPAGLRVTGILDLEEQEKTGPQRTGIENDTPELCSVPNTADQSASLGASVSVLLPEGKAILL